MLQSLLWSPQPALLTPYTSAEHTHILIQTFYMNVYIGFDTNTNIKCIHIFESVITNDFWVLYVEAR